MKKNLLFQSILFALPLLFAACLAPSFTIDKWVQYSLKQKKETVTEAVKFSLDFSQSSGINYFQAAGVNDRDMRKKIESLGSDVFIKYQDDSMPGLMPDSVVVFNTDSDRGAIQVIYDFASDERDIAGIIHSESNYHISKVCDRTYYRRGPFR